MPTAENVFSYPVMLKLKDKKCVIIGGGVVAARKLKTLCEAKAQVTCIAPSFAQEFLETAALHSCTIIKDVYDPKYLENAFPYTTYEELHAAAEMLQLLEQK